MAISMLIGFIYVLCGLSPSVGLAGFAGGVLSGTNIKVIHRLPVSFGAWVILNLNLLW
jgi:hypothetical protein